MLTNDLFERKLQQLREVAARLHEVLSSAKIPYRIIGGFAAFCHVDAIDAGAARLTPDVDIVIERHDLPKVASLASLVGFVHTCAAGSHTLCEADGATMKIVAHIVFVRERVRSEHLEPIPDFSEPTLTAEGFLIAPVADLVRMKLTSFRLKDKVHIQDMDSVGLITAEIESTLSEVLRERLRRSARD